ncbi:MAG TPA: cytochrome c oxidase subunit II [candidate division Zixibacteria bacterium]|nr:cytochrome c oxidase subunit II [candidate division Zixibacteria bacterium]HEQ99381.1 cytochrome c oxidase subunit II [candidate division Zixibacteria bacterium]
MSFSKLLQAIFFSLSLLVILGLFTALSAEEDITNWLSEPATPLAEEVRGSFIFTLLLILPFLFLAEGLLIFVIFKFRKRPGKEPATFHENVKLEIAWTLAPAITLVILALSTFTLIKRINYSPHTDLVVQVEAQRFFWKYTYPEYDIAIAEEPLVVPADKYVTLYGTSMDVIHSWWVPAFGVKKDFMPGRITELWFKAKPGVYEGQCAELCGPLHAEMLIDVKVLPEDEFMAWVREKQAEAENIEVRPASAIEQAREDTVDVIN